MDRSPRWIRLLHYRHGLWGWKSEADGRGFFLARRGRTQPREELDASLTAFFAPPIEEDETTLHPQCRFPARYEWLKSELSFDPARLPEQSCPRLERWLSRLAPQGVTLVFASSYMNNPASMYGHTFLRLDRSGGRDGFPLLDYTVNFAADTPERNGLLFALKGLLGGYPGRFSTQPYYMKIQQYSNLESRDLWEYPLRLDERARRFLVLHLWEMGSTHFAYFFLRENCSYQLLTLLDGADTQVHLSAPFDFKAIPADTVRVVLSPVGFSGPPQLRPSALRTAFARRSLLSKKERELTDATARAENPDLSSLPPERQALILETAYDLVRLRHDYARFQDAASDAQERDLLSRRGRMTVPAMDISSLETSRAEPPEFGHSTGRVGLGRGRRGGANRTEISLRGAMHDLADDPAGYIPGSMLEMFHVRLTREDRTRRARLHRFALLDMVSLFPLDSWAMHPSWRFFFGLDRPSDRPEGRREGLILKMSGGTGPSVSVGRSFLAYAMADADTGAGGALGKSYRLGWGGSTGFVWRPVERWGVWAEAGHLRSFAGEVHDASRLSLINSFRLGKRWEARSTLSRTGPLRESALFIQMYL
ncbi:MAG: DUF4105 domain-containing protein [Elusimicrobia bacterium]|nr:DUF4105 domain-containing protein [Elusimicrobiota bacterium]